MNALATRYTIPFSSSVQCAVNYSFEGGCVTRLVEEEFKPGPVHSSQMWASTGTQRQMVYAIEQ